MKVGDLVRKRWGRLDPYQQGTLAVCIDGSFVCPGLMITGPLVMVMYPGRKPEAHRPSEFEVISEG